MHTENLFKRIISVVLAIALVIGLMPFLGDQILKAVAGNTVKSYAELVNVLASQDPSQQSSDINIELGADITLEAPLTVKNAGVCKISGGDERYTLTADLEASAEPLITVDSGSTLVLTDMSFEDVKLGGALIDNSGVLILDRVSVIDNELKGNVITNNGKAYVNNSTFAGNGTVGATPENAAVISSCGTAEAVILNTTVTGNEKVGIKSELNTSVNIANSLVVSNFYSGSERDLELSGTDTIAYTAYGTVSSSGNRITDNVVEELDTDKHMFNAYYDTNGKPLVYDGVVYLNKNAKVYRNYGTVTYFDYSDTSAVIAGYATIDENSGDQKNVLLTDNGNINSLNAYKVSTYQNGIERRIQVGTQAAVGASYYDNSRYYTLEIRDSENGKITGNIQKVYKEGTRVRLYAEADSGYKLIRFINETDSENRTELSTEAEYTFTIKNDFVISAAFEKLAAASVTLTVNGDNWADQRVELYQFGKVQANMKLSYSNATGKYEGTVYTGTYDIYVNGKDSGYDLSVDESGVSRETVRYASVKYSANGGTGTLPNSLTVPVGSKITLEDSKTLSKADHNFTGWSVEGDLKGTVYAAGSEFTVEKETVLLADWTPIYADARVTVKLNGVPNGSFSVAFRSKDNGTVFNSSYSNGVYQARVKNGGDYEVLINSEVVATFKSDSLIGKEFNYYTVTYHGNGNTDGQSETEKIVLGDSDYVLIGNNYTRVGHYFESWNTSKYGTGTARKPGDTTVIREKTDFYADWGAQNYLVTYDVNGGNELIDAEKTKYIDYDTRYGTLPTPVRTGYRFLYWTYNDSAVYEDTLMVTAADHTLVAQWTPIVYEITVPRGDGLNFSVVPESGLFTADYGTDYKFTLEAKDGYSVDNATVSISNSTDPEAVKVPLEAKDGVYTIEKIAADMTVSVSGVEDTLAPLVEIKITDNKWNTFLNTITFGKFFKNTQTVNITATDAGVGLEKLEYCVGNAMSLEELKALSDDEWTPLRTGESFNIDPDVKLVVYARASDYNNNVAYVCSDGLVFDETAPVIKGISAAGLYELDPDETYIAPITVKVTDEYLAAVTVDGIERTPDKNGEIVIAGSDKPIEIKALDMAGNSTSHTVNVLSSTSVPDGNITEKLINNALNILVRLGNSDAALKAMLITEDDEYAVDCGEDINILLEINGEEKVPEDDKETANAAANERGYTIVKWLDINLIKQYLSRGTEVYIHETSEGLVLVIEIPEEFRNTDSGVTRTFFIGRVHGDNNEFTWLTDTDNSADTVSVNTDKFSTYVLAYVDAGNEVTTENSSNTTAAPTTGGSNITDNGSVQQTQNSTSNGSGSENGGNGTTSSGSSLADTGDRTPVMITVICVIVGCIGFIFFDKKRKKAID